MREALDLAVVLGQRDPQAARRLFQALARPFAVHALEEDRVNTLAKLLSPSDLAECVSILRPLEPNVPWRRGWLALRHRCYSAVGDGPSAARAARDLVSFLAQEPDAAALRLAPDPQ
jgi:hypothetical protein